MISPICTPKSSVRMTFFHSCFNLHLLDHFMSSFLYTYLLAICPCLCIYPKLIQGKRKRCHLFVDFFLILLQKRRKLDGYMLLLGQCMISTPDTHHPNLSVTISIPCHLTSRSSPDGFPALSFTALTQPISSYLDHVLCRHGRARGPGKHYQVAYNVVSWQDVVLMVSFLKVRMICIAFLSCKNVYQYYFMNYL